MTLEIAPEVEELLSDAQLEAVDAQVDSGGAPCVRCGEPIDPDLGPASVILLVDPGPRRAAVRVSHEGCGPSIVTEAAIPAPAAARLAERWASFVLPRVPIAVLQADASVWADERRPALLGMLRDLGFEDAREALDSDLFASGVGAPPTASGVSLERRDEDLVLHLGDGTEIEVLPGILAGEWGKLAAERAGALIVVGAALALPERGRIAFDELLPRLLDRAVGAWVGFS